MEKYSQDERTLNKDKGKLFGSAAKAPGVGIMFPEVPAWQLAATNWSMGKTQRLACKSN